MSDLKRCPFCGGEASAFEDSSHSTAWDVGCYNGACKVEPHHWEPTKEEAAAAWNTRVPDPAAIWREAMEKALETVTRHGRVDVETRTKFMADWIADDIRAIPNPYEVTK